VKAAGVFLNFTAVTSTKFIPSMVTNVPTSPLVGENDVIVGASASALGIPNDIRAAAAAIVMRTRPICFMLTTLLGAG